MPVDRRLLLGRADRPVVKGCVAAVDSGDVFFVSVGFEAITLVCLPLPLPLNDDFAAELELRVGVFCALVTEALKLRCLLDCDPDAKGRSIAEELSKERRGDLLSVGGLDESRAFSLALPLRSLCRDNELEVESELLVEDARLRLPDELREASDVTVVAGVAMADDVDGEV